LRPFAQSLIQSQIVCELSFRFYRFIDEESTAIFRSILQEKRNLTSLRLHNCSFSERVQAYDAIISTLSRPDSVLRTLEFESTMALFAVGQLQSLFRVVEKSKLECFKIGEIRSREQLRTLTQSIPSMCIKELTIVFDSDIDEGAAKREVLQAVKNNFSLRSVKGEEAFRRRDTFNHNDKKRLVRRRDTFNHNEKRRLVFYANRNESLDQWVKNPETVDQKVWPDALQLAQKAGLDSLFRGMRLVLESDYVKIPGARKRKRH